jgi:threonine/homoserine/homoserine lactone efflux protein
VDTQRIVAFLVFAFVAAVTPGPSNIILTSVGANVGVVRGLRCLFGVVMGMGFMIFLVMLGLGSVIVAHPVLRDALKWCGIALLLWLSWKIATAHYGDAATGHERIGFWQAAALQWVNPKSWLIAASAVATYLPAESAGAFGLALWFGTLFFLAALPGCFIWLAFGATVQRFLQSERTARGFNVAMGALVAGSIVLFVR